MGAIQVLTEKKKSKKGVKLYIIIINYLLYKLQWNTDNEFSHHKKIISHRCKEINFIFTQKIAKHLPQLLMSVLKCSFWSCNVYKISLYRWKQFLQWRPYAAIYVMPEGGGKGEPCNEVGTFANLENKLAQDGKLWTNLKAEVIGFEECCPRV